MPLKVYIRFARRSLIRAALILLFFISQPSVYGSTAKDICLSGFYLSKASVPLFILPQAHDDGDMVLLLDMGLFTVMTLPASGVLYQHWIGNRERVELWRKINFGTDLTLAGGVALYGLYMMSKPEPNPDGPSRYISNDLGGLLVIFASALYGLVSLTETIPFSSEQFGNADMNILPLFSFKSKSAGLALQYQY